MPYAEVVPAIKITIDYLYWNLTDEQTADGRTQGIQTGLQVSWSEEMWSSCYISS